MIIVVTYIVERIRVVVDGAVCQRMVHAVGLVRMQITDRGGVTRIHRNRTGQGYSTGAARKGCLASGAAALRRRGPSGVVDGARDGHRVRSTVDAAVVDFVSIVAQRRPGARFHFYVGDVRRHVRVFGSCALFVVRVRLGAEVVCKQNR